MSTLLVVQHVPHERLGTFELAFKEAGCALTFLNTYELQASWLSPSAYDGLVVMGGPQSVYQQSKYPFLTKELALIRAAVKADRPILGVCLGAQLLAEALGGNVTPAEQKEIGWYPLMREPGADGEPLFGPFGQTETVFQWHGDTFDLPRGATQLFSAPLCDQQAFRFGATVWALQFHVEITEAMIATWIVKNKAELARLKGVIDPAAIRPQIPQHLPRMRGLARHVAQTFVSTIGAGAAKAPISRVRTRR